MTATNYPKIKHLTNTSNRDWTGDNKNWYIQEKIDGSQLSFGISDSGIVTFYNKSKAINAKSATFAKATGMISSFKDKCLSKYRYHGEAICATRHNVVQYERVPNYYFILYDIVDLEEKRWLSPQDMKTEAERIGVETVALLYVNTDENQSPYDKCEELVAQMEAGELKSCLGGMPEGVVLKHNAYKERDGRVVGTKSKRVCAAFKERVQSKKAPRQKQTPHEFLQYLGSQFNTPGRFQKGVQHMTEQNKLKNKLGADMKTIVNELDNDFEDEYKELIKDYLWVEFRSVILESARKDFGSWFRDTHGQKYSELSHSKKKPGTNKQVQDGTN